MSIEETVTRFAKGDGRKIPAPPFRHERAEVDPPRRIAPEEEEMYEDEREALMTTQTVPRGGLANFLIGLMALAMLIAFGLFIAAQFGYTPGGQARAGAPPPTPIIRVVTPQEPPQAPPVAQPPIEQPAPVAPALVAPRPAVAPAVEQPTPAARQIIIVKNGNDPAAAPIVIDRGTKRRSP